MKLRTHLLLGYGAVFLLMMVMAVVNYQTWRSVQASQERSVHTQEVIVTGLQLATQIADMQAKIRGFLLTGEDGYWQRAEPRRVAYEAGLARLKTLVADNRRQVARVNEIELLVASWLGAVASEIEERRQVTRGASTVATVARLFSRDQANTTLFASVGNKVEAFVNVEREVLETLRQTQASAMQQSQLVTLGGTALAVLLGLGALLYSTRRILVQVGGEPAEVEAVMAQMAQGNREVTVDGRTGIAASMRAIVATLKDAARQTNAIAAGNYNADIASRSSRDELGIALQAMTRTLRGVAQVAESVADGNLDLEVPANGENDLLARSLNRMIATLKDVTRQANVIAVGDLSANIPQRSDKDELGLALHAMTAALRVAHADGVAQDWLKTGLMRLSQALSGDPDIDTLAANAISEIATYLDAQIGAVYLVPAGEAGLLQLGSRYAYPAQASALPAVKLGDGLVGQAALENRQILIRDVPEDYVRVSSALGACVPRVVCVTPFSHEGRLKGVLEIGSLHDLGEVQLAYLQQAMSVLAVVTESAHRRRELAQTLQKSQQLTEELQVQQEELRVANEELEEQTQRLQASETRLKIQQEELQVTNEELEEKNESLGRQKREVERTRNDLAVKADELAQASKYKSEFLANMSHELRTPLNSLLLLAQGLVRNKDGNLSADQVECAKVIYASGSDLHHLINEILDLSKIEAGHMAVEVAPLQVSDLADGLRASFAHMAHEKGLGFEVVVGAGAAVEIASDRKRIEQILRNLVANAIKFTGSGSVSVTFGSPGVATDLSRSGLTARACLAVAIKDTGVGISADKHKLIFEAFQQAEGGTARLYGGTGLGLTISRELATLLGGEIQLVSEPGQGATFTLYLPIVAGVDRPAPPADDARVAPRDEPRMVTTLPIPASAPAPRRASEGDPRPVFIADDRDTLTGADKLILLIEDDPKFASILVAKCRERGFKCLAVPTGEAGLELAIRHLPCAVILDLRLPGMDGLSVLNTLKEDTRTRHIPVHVVSAEERSTDLLRKGAIGHAVKPLDHERLDAIFCHLEEVALMQPKRLLVIEDDPQVRRETVRLIGSGDITVDEAASGEEAMQALRRGGYDCVVVDLKLPDMDGRDMLERLEREGVALPPVIVHTARDLTVAEERGLRQHAESIVIKDVRSPERLLDEVSLFLHRVVSQMPEQQRQIIRSLHDSDALLQNKKVLIVDDDMRTMFAVSRLLTERGLTPLMAENGARALQLLDEQEVDLVLMDIMMPVMDGYETMRRIRGQERFRKLPIITLTAKAMPEDRQKCLDAGASDYLPKPINPDRLFSMMRVWLYG